MDDDASVPYHDLMVAVRSLSGLPPYGPPACSFPKANAFREGYVVEFTADDGEVWVGNFANGWVAGQNALHSELGASAVVVIAQGAGYIVNANNRRLVREMSADVQHIWYVRELGSLVVSNGLWLEAFDAHRTIWRSRRFSWDGIRNAARVAMTVAGEAFDPTSDEWLPFRADLKTGPIEGGSNSGPSV